MRVRELVVALSVLLLIVAAGTPALRAEIDRGSPFPTAFSEGLAVLDEPEVRPADEDDGLGFGKKVAGTYLDTGEVPLGAPFQGMQTLTLGGTQFSQNLNALAGFGLQDDDPSKTYSSAGQGVWVKTGERSIKVTAIIYIFNSAGDVHLIGKPTVTLEFDEEFATATGPIATELFFPDQDPLTDDPFLTVEGFDTWRRLTVE